FPRRETFREVAGLHRSEIETVRNRVRSRARARLSTGVSNLLPQVDFSLQPLRRECSHVQTVVVKNRVGQLVLVAVEELRNGITDQPALLQSADMGLERQGLVAPGKVPPRHIKLYSGTHAG